MTGDKAISVCRGEFKSPDSSSDREDRGECNLGLQDRPIGRRGLVSTPLVWSSGESSSPRVSAWNPSVLAPHRESGTTTAKKAKTSTPNYKMKVLNKISIK